MSGAINDNKFEPKMSCTRELTFKSDTTEKKVETEIFKLRDIPDTMRAKGWNVGAAIQEKWFNSKARVMPEKEKAGKIISTVYDDTIATWEWLIGFERVQKKYGNLKNDKMKMDKTKEAIIKVLNKTFKFDAETKSVLGKASVVKKANENKWFVDIAKIVNTTLAPIILHPWKDYQKTPDFHYNCQFQYEKLNDEINPFRKIDDLDAAFFRCILNVAICKAQIQPVVYSGILGDLSVKYSIKVLEVAYYLRDTYDFNGGEQYLGHWNKKDCKALKEYFVQDEAQDINDKLRGYIPEKVKEYIPDNVKNSIPDDIRPFDDGAKEIDGEIYYCIRNKHYQAYRNKYNKGGDMVVFTKPKPESINLEFVYTYDEINKILVGG